MKPALLLFLFFITCSWTPCISAQSVKISNKEGKAVGEFETQAFIYKDGKLSEMDGLGGVADFSDQNRGKIMFRIKNLKWFDEELEKKSIEFLKSQIRVRKDEGMEVSSKASKFRLSPNNNEVLDIYFEASQNGNYRIEFPFSTGKLDGRMTRTINVTGLPKLELTEETLTNVEYPANDEFSIHVDSLVSEEKLKEDIDDSEEKNKMNQSSGSSDLGVEKEKEESKLTNDEDSFELTPGEPSYVLNWLPENIVEISVRDLSNPIIETLSHPDELDAISNMNGNIKIKVHGSKPYFAKIRGDEGLLVVDFDNSLKVEVNEGAEDISFTIKGGISPYTIQFLKVGDSISSASERFDNLEKDSRDLIEFSYKALSSNLDGDYTHAIVSDATAENQKEISLTMTIKKETGNTTMIIGGLLGAVLLGVILFFVASKKKKRKREEYKQKAMLLQKQEASNTRAAELSVKDITDGSESGDNPTKKISIQKSRPQHTPLAFGSRDRSPTTSGKLKIKWRDSKGGELETSAFMSLMQSRNAVELNLSEHWADSMVDKVYLSHECIHDLGSFLKKENLSKMQSELQGAIPEVGGFLMGNHRVHSEGNMDIFIDKFVPFVPEYHDVFKIEIGTQTLVQELGDAQDTYPDMDLIGWFHTHPGHGLFLSNSDLSVHKHFSQAFQVAMEIDSLTDRLDTAFFTRKQSGRMNNVEHRNEGATWFAWKEIEKSEI